MLSYAQITPVGKIPGFPFTPQRSPSGQSNSGKQPWMWGQSPALLPLCQLFILESYLGDLSGPLVSLFVE